MAQWWTGRGGVARALHAREWSAEIHVIDGTKKCVRHDPKHSLQMMERNASEKR
jgi:hypothetical protein